MIGINWHKMARFTESALPCKMRAEILQGRTTSLGKIRQHFVPMKSGGFEICYRANTVRGYSRRQKNNKPPSCEAATLDQKNYLCCGSLNSRPVGLPQLFLRRYLGRFRIFAGTGNVWNCPFMESWKKTRRQSSVDDEEDVHGKGREVVNVACVVVV